MNKIFAITILTLALSLNAKSQTKLDLCKKWNLAGYVYWGITFSPEETEKNDYLNFKENGTFVAVDEGKSEKGTWEFDIKNKALLLYYSKSIKPFVFGVIKATNNELILLLKDKEDSITLKFLPAK
jgi:hypothetical protein